MSVIGRVWGWVTGQPEVPASAPAPPPPVEYSPPAPVDSVAFADPAVEKLTTAMTRGVYDSLAQRVRKQAAGLQVAQSQSGLAGIALQLASVPSDASDRAILGEAALQHLGNDPQWKFGLGLASTSGYAVPRWAACQQTLAYQGDLAGLGLKVVQAIPASNYAAERAATGRKALELLGTPNARLAVKAGTSSGYAIPQNAIYETFLANPEGEPCALALQALDKIPTGNYAAERAEAGQQFVLGLKEGRPALEMALAASQTSGYSVPRRILLEAGLENSELKAPADLARLGLAMVKAIPSSNYGAEAAAAAGSVMKSLTAYPELAPYTGLARAMMDSSGYSVPQSAIADRMLEGAALGTPPVEAARQAFEAIPAGNYAAEKSEAAMAAMKALAGDPIADMAFSAMQSSGYSVPRSAIARVAFEAMTAAEKPPLAVLALKMVDAIPTSNYRSEALSAGKSLAAYLAPRYSAARDTLDRARSAGDLNALREALGSVKASDDDRAAIVKMAESITGKAETVSIVQKEDAIIVGGIRVKRRPSDATEARA